MTFDPTRQSVRCDEGGCGRTQSLRYVTTGPRIVVLLGWIELSDGLHRCVMCAGDSDAVRERAAHLAWCISCADCTIEQVTVAADRDLTPAEQIAVERMSAERAEQREELAVLRTQLGSAWVLEEEIRAMRRRVKERAHAHGMKVPKIELSFGTPRAHGVLKRSRPATTVAPGDPRRDRLLALASTIGRKDGWISDVLETDHTERFQHALLPPHLTARQWAAIENIQLEIGECAAELGRIASELAAGGQSDDPLVRAASRVAVACAGGGHDRLDELDRMATLDHELAEALGEFEAQATIIKQLAEELDPSDGFRADVMRFASLILSAMPAIPSKIRQRKACRAEYDDAIVALGSACLVERLSRSQAKAST